MLEQAIVSGIASDTGDAKVTMLGVPDRPGIAADIFEPLAGAHISVDTIVQNASVEQLIRWRLYEKTGGGLMAELGSHQLDASSIFLGKVKPLSVAGAGGRYFYGDANKPGSGPNPRTTSRSDGPGTYWVASQGGDACGPMPTTSAMYRPWARRASICSI